jgi:hypothetical protein
VLNCFSYHLTPGGHIMESGAHALGCAVIPGGPGNTEQQLEAIEPLAARLLRHAGLPEDPARQGRRAEARRPRSGGRWSPALPCRPACAANSARGVDA